MDDEIEVQDENAQVIAAEELFEARVRKKMKELQDTLLSMKKAGVLTKQDYVS